jgi:hypothetical protein
MITIFTYIRIKLATLILSGDGSKWLKIYTLETVTFSYRKEDKNYLAFFVIGGGKMTLQKRD